MDPNQDNTPATVPTFDSPPTPADTQPEPLLTDPVMPEETLSQPTSDSQPDKPELDLSPSPQLKPESKPASSFPAPPTPTPEFEPDKPASPPPTPPSAPKPATVPANVPSAAPFKLGLILAVALVVIGSTSIAAFLYVQNQSLNSQLNAIKDTLSQRELTATPTPSAPVPSPEEENGTSTVAPSSMSVKLNAIIPYASKESATAQLLMITNANILDPKTPYKYWFRRAPNTRNYFVIEQVESETPTLLTQANVTPDNNIPDLIKEHNDGTLGIDAGTSYEVARTAVLTSYSTTTPQTVSVKFLRSGATNSAIKEMNIWQLVVKYPAEAKLADVVVQIDANTSQIVFTNVPETPTK